MEKEIWKDIPCCSNYQVSSYGNVRSITHTNNAVVKGTKCNVTYKGKILRKTNNIKNGYDYVVVIDKHKKSVSLPIHRLVALAFINNPFNKKEVNHINGIKTDNHVTNLEWVTREENIRHAFDNNLIKRENLVLSHINQCKPIIQIQGNKIINTYYSTKEASRQLGIYASTLKYLCRLSKPHSYNGYIYRYANDYDITMQQEVCYGKS